MALCPGSHLINSKEASILTTCVCMWTADLLGPVNGARIRLPAQAAGSRMQQPAGARPQRPAQAPAVRACDVDNPTLTLFWGPAQVLHGPKSPAVGIALVRMANCNLGAWDQGRRAAAGGGESSLLQRSVNLADNGIEILKARAAAGLPSSRILQGGWRAVQLDCSTVKLAICTCTHALAPSDRSTQLVRCPDQCCCAVRSQWGH